MSVTLLMPSLGETMEEGTVSSWLIEVGAQFKRGDALIEFETDKTAVEYPALGTGRLVEVLVKAGDVVKLGEPIAKIDLEGADNWVQDDSQQEDIVEEEPISDPEPTVSQDVASRPASAQTGLVRATPVARRAARQANIDIADVNGSGRRGRIELHDVEAARGDDDGMLANQSWGPQDGPELLLIHGYAGDRTTFEQLAKGLGRAGFHARAIDLPGHGETKAEAADFAALVKGVAANLSQKKPLHLIGHSLGAAIAVKLAKRGGIASLTLISPAGLGLSIDAEFIAGMAEAASPAAIGHLLRRLSPRADGFSEDVIADIHADLARGRLKALANSIVSGGKQGVDVTRALSDLADQIPVRIILGQQDKIVDWHDALNISPKIALHLFAAAGHMPHWDEPAEVLDIIAKGIPHGSS